MVAVRSSVSLSEKQLNDTRRAFDSVAQDYDGPLGNNRLVQRIRRALWAEVQTRVPAGARLLDLGCGTGIDAVHFAQHGYEVVATDWSPEMTDRTRDRVECQKMGESINIHCLGMHELGQIEEGPFDALYSNLGAFNCTDNLAVVARQSAELLRSGGFLIASVIGRVCPWEVIYYLMRGRLSRVVARYKSGSVPVPLNGHTVWTQYYTPGEFYQPFAGAFHQTHLQTLNLLLPPPDLVRLYNTFPRFWSAVGKMEESIASLPGVRCLGDFFLTVLVKRP